MAAGRTLVDTFHAWDPRRQPLSVVAGFDGFVDEMISVVGSRSGDGTWTPMGSMADLGAILAASSGRNGLREMVVRSVDPGGCSVNLGDGLLGLGVAVDHFGTTGSPRHPAFADFASRCRSCTSWSGAYGRSLCLEFADGKFFLAAVDQLRELTVEVVEGALADGAYARACAQAGCIVLTNWSLYPHMTAIWRLLARRVFAGLRHRPWCFIDLVDPSSRSAEDVRAMLATLADFPDTVRVSFGLNLTEATVVSRHLGLAEPAAHPEGLGGAAARLREHLGLDEVVLHNREGNAVAWSGGTAAVQPGPRCAIPRKSTGAGDRFNAGYCLGLLLGLAPADRLDLGSAVAGVFLRRGRSGTKAELEAFLAAWAASTAVDEALGDPPRG